MTEKKNAAARYEKKANKAQHYDYLEELGKTMERKLSEKPYILQMVQQDVRMIRNGVKNEK